MKMKRSLFVKVFFLGALILLFQVSFAAQQKQEPAKASRWTELGALVEASEIDASQYPVFTKWLDESGKTPLDYALEKCREHQIVVFGELHGQKDYVDFFLQLIPEAYHKAGMRYVILEVCKFDDNPRIEKLVEGATYDRNLALEIARSGPWASWNSKEYWDIFEVVWKLNRSLPLGAEHMKVIGMDVNVDLPLNWMWTQKKLTDKIQIEQAKREIPLISKRDELMAAAIEDEVIKNGAKGMVWVGAHHAFAHYAQPEVNDEGIVIREWPRMTMLLNRQYRDRIFQIDFHRRHGSPESIFKKYKGGKPVFSDLMEKIMAARENKPVGFDVSSSPLANVRDSQSYYFHFQPNVRFADLCQGFIFLKPYSKILPCQKIENFVSDAMFEKYKLYYDTSYNKKFASAKEVNEFLKRD